MGNSQKHFTLKSGILRTGRYRKEEVGGLLEDALLTQNYFVFTLK
jgi:hypothetical protein